MTHVQKTVLWTLAVLVFGYIVVHVLVVKAPGEAQAQQPATDRAGSIPLPVVDPAGLGEERAAPAPTPALQPQPALSAVCVDRGLPLDDVIVDIFRQTPGESVFDPRVESFGRTKTKADGKFSVTLPPIRGKTEESEAAAMYILYFTASGRPIKSLIVEDGTEFPKEIFIPTESTEEVYLPTHHLVVAKPEGISVSPMLSAIRGFSKDGQPIRVAQLVDQRNERKTPTSGYGASMGLPGGYSARMGMGRPKSGQSSQQTAQEQILAARKRLTDAKTDEEKQAARAVLRKLLADSFAQDMQLREKQAMEIEFRLARLRQQYKARLKVKDEIIDLQLKVIEQDAAGLGFPGGQSSVPPTTNGRDDVYEPAAALQTRGDEAASVLKRLVGEWRLASTNQPQINKDVPAQDQEIYTFSEQSFSTRRNGKPVARGTLTIDLAVWPPRLLLRTRDEAGFTGGHIDALFEFKSDDELWLAVADTNVRTNEAVLAQPRIIWKLERLNGGGSLGPTPASGTPPATRVDKHDPIPTERTLEEVKKTHPAVVATLKDRGHFIESADGKLYAYANVNYPSGPSIIRVIDSATGKLVATAEVTSTVGKLEFTKDGVNWHEKDGTVQLLVPLAEQSKLIDFSTVEGVVARRATGQPVGSANSLHAGMASDFNELRRQYLQAKGRWAQADTQFSVLLAEARKQNPKTSIDDVKKLHLDAWRENEHALRNYVAARHLIETKLELLDLDLKSAELSFEVAESKLVDLIQQHKDKAASESEVNQQRAVVKATMLDVERVKHLIKLFTSVRSEPVPTEDAQPTSND